MSSLLGLAQRGEAEPLPVLCRLDPRTRILAACAFAVAMVAVHDFRALGLGMVAALLTMGAARLPVMATLKRMVMMDGFIIFMLLMLPFTVPGPAAFTLWGWPASWAGLQQAAVIALKANAVVLALMALVGSQEPSTLGHALARLKVPVRLVHLLLFTVRYLDVIHQEYGRLRVAMKMRGFRPRNTLHTYRSVGYLIGMLLVRALERSERILKAMKCRGFTGQLPLLDDLRYRPRDGWFAALWLGLLLLVLTLNWSP
ncbi:cobalt ECF transporter T component CbiQ [Insolitispirillum peregrinum]|uniref:cobalt ECF transporter T component CbiQ n=1 Tax=Insolitispirillum peregrinum TaxID=80876 RepID=UPI003614802D